MNVRNFSWLASHVLFREWTMKCCASHTSPHDRMSLLLWNWFIVFMSSNQSIPHNRQPTVIDSWVAAESDGKKKKLKKKKKKKLLINDLFSVIFDFFCWSPCVASFDFLFLKFENFIRELYSELNYRSDSYSLFLIRNVVIGTIWCTNDITLLFSRFVMYIYIYIFF